MAKWLGIPARSWYSYERGVAIPGPLILRIIVATAIEPSWLLHGTGPKYRRPAPAFHETSPRRTRAALGLLRSALRQLDDGHLEWSNPPRADGMVEDAAGRTHSQGSDRAVRCSA